MSNEVINKLAFWDLTSSANAKESLETYLFLVRSERMGTRNLASSYDGVRIADNIGRKGGDFPKVFLCTLQRPYKTPG